MTQKKSSKQNKSMKKPAARAQHVAGRPQKGVEVEYSQCTKDYASSSVAPWNNASPCLPHGFPLASRKMKTFARGIATIGSDIGFVIARPAAGASNNNFVVLSTDAGYAGSTVRDSTTMGVNASVANSDYASSSFSTSSNQYRLVTAGIRIKYRGTALARGGRIVALEEPDHQSLDGHTVSQLLSYKGATSLRPSGGDDWTELVSSGPKVPSELQYSENFLPTANPSNNAYMVLAFEGVPDLAFEWEFWGNYEIIGSDVRSKTISHHDAPGAFSISNALTVLAEKGLGAASSKDNKLAKVITLGKQLFKGAVTYLGPKVLSHVMGGPAASLKLLG